MSECNALAISVNWALGISIAKDCCKVQHKG